MERQNSEHDRLPAFNELEIQNVQERRNSRTKSSSTEGFGGNSSDRILLDIRSAGNHYESSGVRRLRKAGSAG